MPDRPNFFLVGAPKCGTTSIYTWLKDHHEVFMPATKEPHFFADQREYRVISNLDDYLAMYKGAGASKAIGEGSTTYLHTPGALENVREFDPNAKIIIAVRDPIGMAQSLHGHMLFFQNDNVEDFEEAWRLGAERGQGRSLPQMKKIVDPIQVNYQDMALLGKYVERALTVFPADQVKIVVADDLSDRVAVYRDILGFLNLDDDGRTTFESQNVGKSHGKSLILKIVTGLPAPVTGALRKLGFANTGLGDKLTNKFGKAQERKPLRPEFEQEMKDFYRSDVEKLGNILGRDLSHWVS
ncbi:sulfotransferase [soil metagenome]